MERLGARELEIIEVLFGPALGELARGLSLECFAEDADRHDLAVATVRELVRNESRLGAYLICEALIDPPREFIRQPPGEAVAPNAREHFAAPFLLCRSI